MKTIVIWAVAVVAAFLGGCAVQQEPEVLTELCLVDVDAGTALKEAEDVLGKMHFVVEKSDAQAGYLRTRPLRGGQFF